METMPPFYRTGPGSARNRARFITVILPGGGRGEPRISSARPVFCALLLFGLIWPITGPFYFGRSLGLFAFRFGLDQLQQPLFVLVLIPLRIKRCGEFDFLRFDVDMIGRAVFGNRSISAILTNSVISIVPVD
ncbi:MAG: hypothetical protein ACRD30_10650 [Bryobacteraceae bacterium]